MIKNLIQYYEEYQKIVDSYCGQKTDWHKKSIQLGMLVRNVSVMEVRSCRNQGFYIWVRRVLRDEIETEYERVSRLAKNQIRKEEKENG